MRRDRASLQIGTSPGVVIADRPGLTALLRLADGTRDVERLQAYARTNIPELTWDVADLMNELRALGVIFDSSRWSAPHRRGLDAEARHTDLAGGELSRLTRRPLFRVAFHTDAATEPIATAARAVLADSGIRDLDSNDPDLLVIASSGEPARSVFERATMAALDHLVVMIDENRVRIGPLVRPGRTPCMSCYDLHRAGWDHAWSALIPQFGRHTGILTPAALDAVTVHAAALEVAIDVLSFCDRRPTRTIGQFLAIGPEHGERDQWPLAFHHGCACDLLSAA